MLDYDSSPDYEIYEWTPKSVMNVLYKFGVPRDTAYCWRASSSSFNGSLSFHMYFPVHNVSDFRRFGLLLDLYCYQEGYGYIKPDVTGRPMYRTIFDSSVYSPERIEFLVPVVAPDYPIKYREPEHALIEGQYLDTSTFKHKLVDLNVVDTLKKRLLSNAERTFLPEARMEYDHRQKLTYFKLGYSENEAEKIVKKNRQNDYQLLELDTIIHFRDHGPHTIREALKLGLTGPCKDPLANKHDTQATFYLDKIRSFYNNNVYYFRTKKLTVHYVTPDPGLGKTTKLLEIINADYSIDRERSIVVMPTHALIRQEVKKVKGHYIHISNGSDKEGQLYKAIADDEHLIFVTHALFKQINLSLLHDYHIYVDETFDSHIWTSKNFRLKHSISDQGIFKTALTWKPIDGSSCKQLTIKSKKKIQEYLKKVDSTNSADTSSTKEILKRVLDGEFVLAYKTKKRQEYIFASFWNPSTLKCKSLTVFSAFFKTTQLYCHLSLFFNLKDITNQFEWTRSLDHRLSKVHLSHLFEDYSLTQNEQLTYLLDDKPIKGPAIAQSLLECKQFDDETLVILNKKETKRDGNQTLILNSKEDDELQEYVVLDAKLESCYLHGRNDLTDATSLISINAYNLDNINNLIQKELYKKKHYSPWYDRNVNLQCQLLMRLNCRVSDSKTKVYYVVVSKRIKEAMIRRWPMMKQFTHCLSNRLRVPELENLLLEKPSLFLREDNV